MVPFLLSQGDAIMPNTKCYWKAPNHTLFFIEFIIKSIHIPPNETLANQ